MPITKKIKFKIVTPEKVLFESEVDQVTLPASDGQVTILPDHRSYIASLKSGEILLKTNGKEQLLVVSSGFVEFNKNNLVVLADTAESADEIDVDRAEQARKRAEEIKHEKVVMNEMEYATAAAAIEKEAMRIRVARKHQGKKGINIDQL